MKIKPISLLLLSIICLYTSVNAQDNSLQKENLFSDYTEGKVLMKNKSVIKVSLNYDCINREMNYLENNERMILQGLNTVDTIYIADRKFIPHENIFLELIPTSQGSLYVDWKTRVLNAGKKGAMGMVTQSGTVDKLDVKRMQNEGVDPTGNTLYKFVPENTYYIRIDNKLKKFNSLKSFCKLLPKAKEDAVKSFSSNEKIDFQSSTDVVKLINFISIQ